MSMLTVFKKVLLAANIVILSPLLPSGSPFLHELFQSWKRRSHPRPGGLRTEVGIACFKFSKALTTNIATEIWRSNHTNTVDHLRKHPLTLTFKQPPPLESTEHVPNWLTYDFPPAVKAKVNRLWGGGEWHGQAQKWFLMRLTKDDSEVNLAKGEAEPEFAEWKWANPEEVIEQAVDYKRPTYEEVTRTFQPYFNRSSISTKCKSSKW